VVLRGHRDDAAKYGRWGQQLLLVFKIFLILTGALTTSASCILYNFFCVLRSDGDVAVIFMVMRLEVLKRHWLAGAGSEEGC
jgi:hypothetical protein